ncbi:MAG: hypothetical protein QM536_09120 [Chitinophagaceae bacterium]|nr:hypothetical protein [Chitinophagaceae bacterium]
MLKKDFELEIKWQDLLNALEKIIGKKPENLDAVLFIIGIQELGKGTKKFTKDEKQDLMHIAICKVMSLSGFYELEGVDPEGWPHWKMIKKIPKLNLFEQEKLLKINIIDYFQQEVF